MRQIGLPGGEKENSPRGLDEVSPKGNTIAAMEILKTWLAAERGRSGKLARHLAVAPSFITKMANGEKPIPSDQAAQIELFTGGAVSRQLMFPDSWARIWPELAEAVTGGEVQPSDLVKTDHPVTEEA